MSQSHAGKGSGSSKTNADVFMGVFDLTGRPGQPCKQYDTGPRHANVAAEYLVGDFDGEGFEFVLTAGKVGILLASRTR